MIYSCTNYRHKKSEIGIRFNDKDLKIKWPIKNPILSIKDKNNINFKIIKKNINYNLLVAGSGIEPLTSGL